MSAVVLASKTLAAFEREVARDQGAAFRVWEGKVLPHLSDAYRGEEEGFRSHMGASAIGGECARAIWYGFRWATKARFTGQMLRLFNRGHLEEGRFIALLLTIGCKVYQQDENGNQFRISSYGGHFGGSGDGVVVGCPDLPAGVAALSEFKTHNDASFKTLKKDGVRSAKLEHFVQMQTYMRKMGLKFALYLAINKNNDEIYGEIVALDESVADQFIGRAHKIIPMQLAPDKISKTPGWKTCSWCDHRPVCHLGVPPERNCRTCQHSIPREDGAWVCSNPIVTDGGQHEAKLSKANQLAGCAHYEPNKTFAS
jgi:hypothetical protein